MDIPFAAAEKAVGSGYCQQAGEKSTIVLMLPCWICSGKGSTGYGQA
jgi:hypothetical protein